MAESDGRRTVLEAGEVVLCAGALVSPHLLHLSGIGPAADLERGPHELLVVVAGVRVALADRPALPVLATQHRVIGAARCHFTAPSSLTGPVDAPGKLFVTSDGLVFAGSARVFTWPWHRVRAIMRSERALVVTLAGAPDPIAILCNTYGDAMTARYLAARLRPA